MATYAVGDIQGCFDELIQLIELINLSPDDQLWLAGDLVNRGPQSLKTLRLARSLCDQVKVVLGNHDLHLLAVARGGAKSARKDTLDAILNAPDRELLLDWLQQQPLLHHDQQLGFTMTHAGIPPQWSLAEAKSRADEVASALQSENAGAFLKSMYGNKPSRWKDSHTGIERLRCITNYFTRMRFCDERGKLDFDYKESPAKPPLGYAPWFAYPYRAMKNQKIVFGHWAALNGKTHTPNTYALDTGCAWGGSLTAMRLETETLFSVPSLQQTNG